MKKHLPSTDAETPPKPSRHRSPDGWRDRFDAIQPLRRRGAFHIYTARQGGEPRVVVTATPGAARPESAASLARLRRHHELTDHPLFPHPACAGPGWVALEADAVGDCEQLVASLSSRGEKLPFDEAIAFVELFVSALGHAHALRDDGDGRPLCVGALALSSLLYDRSGKVSLVGLGHPVCAMNEHGLPAGIPWTFMAPEVAAGGAPSPAGDVYAGVGLLRALHPYVQLPSLLARVLRAEESSELSPLLAIIDRAVLAAPPRLRIDATSGLRAFRRAWRILGATPNHAGLERTLARHASLVHRPSSIPALLIGQDARWLEGSMGRFDLGRRLPLRRLLLRLVERRLDGGEGLSIDALLEAGWPGERPLGGAGRNRVHVALSELRKLGLRDVILRGTDGYRLDPRVPVKVAHE